MYTDNLFSYQPYWSIIPPTTNWPYETWIGDFPPFGDKKSKDDLYKGWAERLDKAGQPITSKSVGTLFDKQVWFNNTDDSASFKLEVVGYGQEHISAEIKDSTLHVSGKRGQKSFSQQYQIPSPEKLDLDKVSAKVEHGLLEITFSAKKTEVKSVKIL